LERRLENVLQDLLDVSDEAGFPSQDEDHRWGKLDFTHRS
jgi:hypothetical protein